ncbi:hypothetical protein B566_EDAN008318 [Ephemera danica]|nr:hypothetical protein B566_EDAN008318 [Ephemera danica]
MARSPESLAFVHCRPLHPLSYRTFTMNYTVHFVLVLAMAMSCLARPGFITSSSYRAGGPYSPVGGQSIVNVFPAGYAYQTLLDDGSLTQVLYVTGPDSEIVQQSLNLLRTTGTLPVNAAAVASESKDAVATPAEAKADEPNAPEAPGIAAPERAASPAAPVSFFGFPSAFTTYLANPFNSLMSFLGLPTLDFRGTAVGQASNVVPLRAPLSNRVRTSSVAPDTTSVTEAASPSSAPVESTAAPGPVTEAANTPVEVTEQAPSTAAQPESSPAHESSASEDAPSESTPEAVSDSTNEAEVPTATPEQQSTQVTEETPATEAASSADVTTTEA